jgi:hypothetical protein
MNHDEFIVRAKKVWGDKFDYSLAKYTKSCEKITLICPKHGKFRQMAQGHLQGKDCAKCAKKNQRWWVGGLFDSDN